MPHADPGQDMDPLPENPQLPVAIEEIEAMSAARAK